MTKDKAEKLVCPFISGFEKVGEVAMSKPKFCITEKCMAWKTTGYEMVDNKRCESGHCKRLQ